MTESLQDDMLLLKEWAVEHFISDPDWLTRRKDAAWRVIEALELRLAVPAAQPPDRTDGRTHWAGCWREHLPCAIARIHELESQQPAPASGGEPDDIAERLRGLAQSRNRGERVRLDADDCRALLAAANLLTNQCDGCRRGMPLRDGNHYMPNSLDMIGCTAHLYRHPPASGTGSEDTRVVKWKLGAEPSDPHDFHRDIYIEERIDREGRVRYAVLRRDNAWTKEGIWESEPIPSSRGDAYMDRARYDSFAEALMASHAALSPSDQGEPHNG